MHVLAIANAAVASKEVLPLTLVYNVILHHTIKFADIGMPLLLLATISHWDYLRHLLRGYLATINASDREDRTNLQRCAAQSTPINKIKQ